MKITIFSDLHINGPTETKVSLEFGENVFYIGDNHEFKNIPYKKVHELKLQFSVFLAKCRSTLTNVLNGNHEASVGFYLVDKETLHPKGRHDVALEHGDICLGGYDYHDGWMKKVPGKSWRVIKSIKVKNWFRRFKGSKKLSKRKIKLMLDRARILQVTTLIIGHNHPKTLIDEVHSGIRLVIVPQGKTVLEV